MKKTYEIRASRLSAAKAIVEKANKRAAKVGAPPVSLTVVREFEKNYSCDDVAFPHVVRYAEVEVDGETPKFAGWTFLATLDHSHETGTVVRSAPDATIPERFWTAKPTCEHCQENRRRKDTYVVQHDDGTIKQVGSSCIQDFLGGEDPQAAISTLKNLTEICGFLSNDDEGFFEPREEFRVETFYWLKAAVAEIRINGFTSAAKARDGGGKASSACVHDYFFSASDEDRKRAAEFWSQVTEDDGAVASKLIEWASKLQVREDDSFLRNVKIIASSTSIGHRDFGIATAAVVAYHRDLSKRIEAAAVAATSQYVGEVGVRQVFEATLVTLKTWEGDYGMTFFHKFFDVSGNVLIWFGSGNLCHHGGDEVKIGEKVTFKATVKAHNERQGVHQTILNRCSGYVPPAPKVRKSKTPKASEESPILQPSSAELGGVWLDPRGVWRIATIPGSVPPPCED
jgi:hypothetical protein